MSATVWMTPAALELLREELATLEAASRDDDPTTRARIVELRERIAAADTSPRPDDGLVEPGMRVVVRLDGADAPLAFVLGDRSLVAPGADETVYSPTSPMGAAVDGRYVGDTVTFETPRGPRSATILEAHPVA
ncbi:transcription elongation factor GreA [Demequina sediminis]|uniref:Transcription elongation factor GreA n=1 Tax=Demequina sediminis TaxID=1930058 RepID=A0ABP9WGM9_9MICO|nr:GreA/GreB family elongation factor [Demequina sediminis]BDZ62661.1 hypothetical protein GCM10025873_24520 [Demequina sediminis]